MKTISSHDQVRAPLKQTTTTKHVTAVYSFGTLQEVILVVKWILQNAMLMQMHHKKISNVEATFCLLRHMTFFFFKLRYLFVEKDVWKTKNGLEGTTTQMLLCLGTLLVTRPARCPAPGCPYLCRSLQNTHSALTISSECLGVTLEIRIKFVPPNDLFNLLKNSTVTKKLLVLNIQE